MKSIKFWPTWGKVLLGLFTAIVGIVVLTASQTKSATLAETYPGPWQNFNPLPISQTLVKTGAAKYCGEYYHRESSFNTGEFLVYCKGSEMQWTAFLVWPSLGKVIGPNHISGDLPLP